jgi:hypothetical protein
MARQYWNISLKSIVLGYEMDSCGSFQAQVMGSCEHGTKSLGSMKCIEFVG